MPQQGAEPWVKAGTPTACRRGWLDGRCWLPKEQRAVVNKKIMGLNLRGRLTSIFKETQHAEAHGGASCEVCRALEASLPGHFPHPLTELLSSSSSCSSSTGHSGGHWEYTGEKMESKG